MGMVSIGMSTISILSCLFIEYVLAYVSLHISGPSDDQLSVVLVALMAALVFSVQICEWEPNISHHHALGSPISRTVLAHISSRSMGAPVDD